MLRLMQITYEEFLRLSIAARPNDDSEATTEAPTDEQIERTIDRARTMGVALAERRDFEEWAAIEAATGDEPDASDW
jgi:hypothetical protein